MGRKAKLKELRRLAERATAHMPDEKYDTVTRTTKRLGECTKGAYKALKKNQVQRAEV